MGTTDYKAEIDRAKQSGSIEEFNRILTELPNGMVIGKKIDVNGKIYAYSYTEKQKYLMEYLYGQDIEKEFESDFK